MTKKESLRLIALDMLERSNDSDPKALALRLSMRLTPEQRDEAVLTYCRDLLTFLERTKRRDNPTVASGRSRWEVVTEFSREWRFLEQCTYDDLLSLADQYAARAARNAEREREMRELAAELQASGFATVGEMRAAQQQVAA